MALDDIIEIGNDPRQLSRPTNHVKAADGFKLSVTAHSGAYCTPRDSMGPYTHVEVGYPSERPEPWEPIDSGECWSKYAESPERPTGTVYGWVPVAMVRALLRTHGGEA